MALSNRDCRHGRKIGKCADCELDELTALRKQDDALILQLVEALEYHRAQTRPIDRTDEAITAGRARLQHLSEEKSKEQ